MKKQIRMGKIETMRETLVTLITF